MFKQDFLGKVVTNTAQVEPRLIWWVADRNYHDADKGRVPLSVGCLWEVLGKIISPTYGRGH